MDGRHAKAMTKRGYVLALGLLCSCGALGGYGCAKDPATSGTGGSSMKGSGGSTGSGGATGSGGNSTGSGGSSAGSGGAGASCDMPSLSVFARSDTDQSWDDNDFSDVTVDGSCPAVANVTWPHEADWENKDPSESNREQVHFTLDSYYSSDLTGKQINLDIELTGDKRGSNATAGGYIVSLVSVSSYDKVVGGSGGMGGSDTGGASGAEGGAGGEGTAGGGGESGGGRSGGMGGRRGGGMGGRRGGAGGRGDAGGLTGSAGSTQSGAGGTTPVGGSTGSTGSGGDSGSGGSGDTPVIEKGYSEAETPAGDRKTLSKMGDKVSMSFKLPNKGTAVDSYDPARPVKINIRIYTLFSSGDSSTYDYMTSQFTIRKFEVGDAK